MTRIFAFPTEASRQEFITDVTNRDARIEWATSEKDGKYLVAVKGVTL